MPLVRYRTGDLGRWLPDPCPCGTRLRTLAHITTRVSGAVPLGDGASLTQADLDEAVFAVDGVIDFAAGVLRGEPGATLSIRIRVAPGRTPDVVRDAVAEAVASVGEVARAAASGNLASIDVIASAAPLAGPTLAKRSITSA
jgi:phenylacetate-coenzyme A ligase PaaK-like adenylate-forming protein